MIWGLVGAERVVLGQTTKEAFDDAQVQIDKALARQK